jgi:CRISPR-associated protein Cas2
MFSVVCYDIPDDRRRNKVGKILEGFGTRVQKSVFECDIKPDHMKLLKQKLIKVINEEDTVRYYYLCAQCIPKVEVVNGPPVTQAQLYFAV